MPIGTLCSPRAAPLLVLALAAAALGRAQETHPREPSGEGLDYLLSISEPERIDLYGVATAAPAAPLPVVDLVRRATDARLAGDYAAAVPLFAELLQRSRQPVYAFFYAQALRATGRDVLAALYEERYAAGEGGHIAGDPRRDLAAHTGATAAVSGRITNRRFGNAVPGVTVTLVNLCTERRLTARTDAAGRYRFAGLPADCAYVVEARKPHLGAERARVAAPGTDVEVDFALARPGGSGGGGES